MDIAWRAEAYPVSDRGMVYVAIAPLVQQLAALELLSARELAVLDGSAMIEDAAGRRTPFSFVSIRDHIFDCYEVKPTSSGGGHRPVLLTCGFDAETAAAYMGHVSAIARGIAPDHRDHEGGFVGAFGLSDALERRLFERIPREPMPASDFMAAVGRAAAELVAG